MTFFLLELLMVMGIISSAETQITEKTPALYFQVKNKEKLSAAFTLAVSTIDRNTHDSILAAGADYGGEWARDAAINAWNAASLLRPGIAERSLWNVTVNQETVGHQYWDKIIWVVAALYHYRVTGNMQFLRRAYLCSKNTMRQLEETEFDSTSGLFRGPSVMNDGIAGYPEPPAEPDNYSSFVLNHPDTKYLKCLSTNCLYYGAYQALIQMADLLKSDQKAKKDYQIKAKNLQRSVVAKLWLEKERRFGYFIDKNGQVDTSQEGLGGAFAVIFDIVNDEMKQSLIDHTVSTPFGITNVYPDFPQFSPEKPGRHNNIVWPMINGFWGYAAYKTKRYELFQFELENLANLALDKDKGDGNFREVYNPYTGAPDGGWQVGNSSRSCNHQTWPATAYLRLVLHGLLGIQFEGEGIYFSPYLPRGYDEIILNNLTYRNCILNMRVTGTGNRVSSFKLDGKTEKFPLINTGLHGNHQIEIEVTDH